MKLEIYKCDVCGARKHDTNHWWKAYVMPRYVAVTDFAELSLDEMAMKDLDLKPLMHLCGEACVQRKMAEFMGSVSK